MRARFIEVMFGYVLPFFIFVIIAGPISKTTFFQSKNGYRLLFVSLVIALITGWYMFVGW